VIGEPVRLENTSLWNEIGYSNPAIRPRTADHPDTFRRLASEILGRGLCLIRARVIWHDSLLFLGVVPGDNADCGLSIAQVARLMWNVRRDVQEFTRTTNNALAQAWPIGCLHPS
jgi:hypothetical protein